MAKFKLYLINLNTVSPDKEPTYFKQVISEFYDQRTEYLRHDSSSMYTYCHTYNEKFQESTNSQKILSFSMDRKIIRDDRIEDNPFVYNIAIGTQLLLEDKYGHQHLMTVKDIKFDFKELNLTYNFQCQDSFTWQLSRQNDGYEIINDASSKDFLGAKNIDDWTRKICSECNVVYTYRGFIDNVNNELSSIQDFNKTIPFSGSGTADSMLISLAEQYGLQIKTYEHFNDNNTITKEFSYIPLKSLHPSGLKYSPYYDIQSFSLGHSGTSLSSVLNVKSNTINDEVITLIPSVPAFFRSWFETADWHNSQFSPGMFSNKCRVDSIYISNSNHIVYISTSNNSVGNVLKNNSKNLYSQFWTTKPDFSTIKYGGNDINDLFNNTTADDFTSISDVNIEYNNKTYNYLVIEWKSVGSVALDYTPKEAWFGINGDMNTKLELKEDMYFIVKNLEDGEKDLIMRKQLSHILNPNSISIYHQKFLYIPLHKMFLNSNYPFVRFQSQENQSYIHTEETRSNQVIFNYHYNSDNIWSLVRLDGESLQEVRANLDQIPESWFNQSYEYFIKIPFANTDAITIIDSDIYIDFYREPTMEEIQFATIADQCPWLENKLFSFDYFYNHQIINRKQYNELQQYIQNDLRKSSAKLLLYSQLYYEQVKAKTENLAKLESQVDTLGAIFNAEFIAPFNERKAFESSDFITAYTSLFVGQTETGIGLLDYSKTMTDYLNKYINAEQTFLKNIYLFKNYFNAKTDFGKLYTYTVTIDKQTDDLEYISFSRPDTYQKISMDNSFKNYIDKDQLPTTQIYEKEIVETEDGDKTLYKAISRDELVGLNNMQDEDLYYIDSLEAKYRIWTQKTDSGEYDTLEDYVITSHEYNPDTQYLEEQWVYIYTGNIQLDYGPATSGMYELYKIDRYNNKAYVRSKDHCIQNKPGNLVFSVKTGEDTTTEISLSNPISIYVKVDLFEMKCNYFYRCKNDKLNPSSTINYRRIDVEPQNLIDALNLDESVFIDNKDNHLKGITKYFPNNKNDEEEDTLENLYNANFPLTTIQYHYQEQDKNNETVNKIADVDFVNYNTAANFYRRISATSGGKAASTLIGGAIAIGLSFVSLGLSIFAGSAIAGLAKLRWRYGPTSWGTEGWTYQDIWGSSSFDGFNSSWSNLPYMLYTKTASAWEEVFGESTSKPTEEENFSSWNYLKAKNLLFTPTSFKETSLKEKNPSSSYKYTPYYWRVLTNNDYINSDESYKVIFYKESDVLFNINKMTKRLNAIINYPLSFIMDNLPLSDFNFEKNKKPTLAQMMSKASQSAMTDYENDMKWVVLHEEHYDTETLTDVLNTKDVYELARSQWYDNDHFIVDFSIIPGLADGFFINKNNENYKSVIDSDITNDTLNDKFYYRKKGNQHIQQNTLAQQIAEGNTYTKLGDQTTYITFEDLSEIELPVNVYTKDKDSWIFKHTKMQKFNSFTKNSDDLGSMTNGLFWAKYYNHIDQTVLMQKAMLIETNLTEYWTNAYYASKNCRFFLPQYWQPVINSQINYFSNEILMLETDSKGNLTNIKLNNTYIPTVKCKSEQPYYIYTYTDTPEVVDDNMEKVYNKRISLQKACNDSEWLNTSINYLGIDKSKCIVTIPRYDAAHYIHQSGGQTWYETLNSISQGQFISFDKFGGWYDMVIKTLNTRYYSIEMTQYEEARRKHNAAWQYLHRTYPHLIYEKAYENADATTSEQLLAAAQFAFRQYNDVERQYNIQTIDLAGLKGYDGQHLQIGDAIELDADELYEAYDDIKTSLLQYLYVSDISYDLRNDANIQLTVNDIKYSDKVIGELVKLIR